MGEAKRVFDYYDSIFQSTQDPDILTEVAVDECFGG